MTPAYKRTVRGRNTHAPAALDTANHGKKICIDVVQQLVKFLNHLRKRNAKNRKEKEHVNILMMDNVHLNHQEG